MFEDYLGFSGLMAEWGFFAPEPGFAAALEWEALNSAGQVIQQGTLPTSPDPYFFRERQNRRITVVRFMYGSSYRYEKMMVPYVCSQVPQAKSVQIWQKAEHPLALTQASRKLSQPGSLKESLSSTDRQWMVHSFCEQKEG
ncbi:MAG: hypothetical protein ACO3A2_04185 [Bdellovibrionia bacterium]